MKLRILVLIAFATGVGLTYFVSHHAAIKADQMARTDYAELVNSCYKKTADANADALYSCIISN